MAAQLGNGVDQLTSYVISFYVIAQFWLIHHRVFRRFTGQPDGLVWWNFAFLFTITVMPFTSNLLGEYGSNPLAVDIFAFNLLLASLSTQATLEYGRRKDLLAGPADPAAVRTAVARGTATAAVIAASIGVAWVSTSLAKYCWLLIVAAPWAADRWSARRGVPDAG
ncbi:MAG TPA: TMEM175 family protein [Streptosporangiaceae bacterium]